MEKDNKLIRLFWTSGWDSTFRLLQILLTTDRIVEPHFILRTEQSTGIEIDAQIKIRRLISRKYPEVMPRLLPTVYTNAELIKVFKDIKDEIESLRKEGRYVDPQYDLMANYCRQFNIDEIELGLEKTPGEPAEEWLDKHFHGASVFNCFRYPVFHLTKRDMLKIIRENKWDDIMDLTNFCRRPIIKVTPCGTCGPCIDTVVAGMDFRLPFKARMKARVQTPLRVFWRNNYPKYQNNRFFKFAKKKLENRF